MEIKPVSNRMYGFLILFDMHTDFFYSVLADLKDEDLSERLNTKANHIAWLAGSLVQQRFDLENILGGDLKASADELFRENKGIQDDAIYPSLEVYIDDWKKITPILRDLLLKVGEEELDKILEFPGMSFPVFEMISFNTYREANTIGQIALWRRLLGYNAMKYM
ncbi:MAG: DinB family protein [Flavobacterium sp.]|nr:MAG: DinB family protein [Flavobacterium sp.]